ncbi:MAG: hypothetical protein WAW17_15285 [Rhodococcus sp. (in: high G+C Gram-positive bacteria)]|uniref:hypothetical protein n=1 Tax=Rhodococcus sp. TaxID=1831 RepID=UPI003BB10FA2
MTPFEVTENAAENRYELRVEGQLAGFTAYLKKHDDFRDITDPITPAILSLLGSPEA